MLQLSALQGGNEDPGRLKLQVQELSKENQLLKRAVAIQNTRLQVRHAAIAVLHAVTSHDEELELNT